MRASPAQTMARRNDRSATILVTGSAIIRLMHRINEQKRVTFVTSTHDVSIVNLAARRIALKDGIVLSDGMREAGAFRGLPATLL